MDPVIPAGASGLEAWTWPAEHAGELVAAMSRVAGLVAPDGSEPPTLAAGRSRAGKEEAIAAAAGALGLEAEPAESEFAGLREMLLAAAPAVLAVPGPDDGRLCGLLGARRGKVRVLDPELKVRRVSVEALEEAVAGDLAPAVRDSVERLLHAAGVPPAARPGAIRALTRERLATRRISGLWLLRLPESAPFGAQLRKAGIHRRLGALLLTVLSLQALWLFAWLWIGRATFAGTLDRPVLVGWGLMLLGLLPLRLWSTHLQGEISIHAGALLKRRLLGGSLRIAPDRVRGEGAGQLVGRVFESEALERLALGGGFLTLIAALELLVAVAVLTAGAGGIGHALLLAAWMGGVAWLATRYFRARGAWTRARLHMTHGMIEGMVGYRTRLAQEAAGRWHHREDAELEAYLSTSRSMDRIATALGASHRGWIVLGVAGMAPAFAAGAASPPALAVAVGGVLMGFHALQRFADGMLSLVDARIAWDSAGLLFHATSDPASGAGAGADEARGVTGTGRLEARRVSYRYHGRGRAVLDGCDLSIAADDRVLVEGPSGGGKSTLTAVLAGLRTPDSGLVLFDGLDPATLGADAWRRRVVAAPQFHENFVFTETFAFNLLMGRRWPATRDDLAEAESVCRALDLGGLLDRMPGGLMQMVGDTGWQLSHGERSRLFIARALLQRAAVVILDESLAALDAGSLRASMDAVLARAPALVLVAHP